MRRYCHQCGFEIGTVANFCPKCGTNLSSLSSVPASKTPLETPAPKWANEEDEDGEEYIDRDSHRQRIRQIRQAVGKLDIEISAPPTIQGEKLGTFAATSELDRSNFREGPFANLTPDQVKEQFKQEAGSKINESKVHSINADD